MSNSSFASASSISETLGRPRIRKRIIRTILRDVTDNLRFGVGERNVDVAQMRIAREVARRRDGDLPADRANRRPSSANGHPGIIVQKIREAFFDIAEETAI